MFVTLSRIICDGTRKRDYRLAVFFRKLSNADGCFPHNSLRVQTALAGNNDICVRDVIFQTCFV